MWYWPLIISRFLLNLMLLPLHYQQQILLRNSFLSSDHFHLLFMQAF